MITALLVIYFMKFTTLNLLKMHLFCRSTATDHLDITFELFCKLQAIFVISECFRNKTEKNVRVQRHKKKKKLRNFFFYETVLMCAEIEQNFFSFSYLKRYYKFVKYLTKLIEDDEKCKP